MTNTLRFIAVTVTCCMLIAAAAPPVLAWRNDQRGWNSPGARHHQGDRPQARGYQRNYRNYGYSQQHHHRGEAVVLGIVGGLVGLAILDQILTPPPVVYAAPPPGAFGAGYSDGYDRGYDRAQRDLYRDGRVRGYEDGYREGRY